MVCGLGCGRKAKPRVDIVSELTSDRPRVLVVTYYFPPSGGSGVQRMLKAVRYFRDAGVEPVVLTVEAGAYATLDPALAADVPDGVRVVRTAALDPFGLYGRLTGRSRKDAVAVGSATDTVTGDTGAVAKLALWARANVFLPDARVGWAPFARRAARQILREARREGRPFGGVITSGPPHSVHLVGLAAQREGVRWTADFRDPWTGITFYDELPMTRAARRFDGWLERRVLRRADAVVTVSPSWARHLGAQGGLAPGTVRVVHNGFDTADFEGVAATPPATDGGAFVLAYVGSLYGPRNPHALWGAMRQLRADGRADGVRVRLVGLVVPEVLESARAAGVDVEHVPYVPHAEAVAEMARATALLLSIDPTRLEDGILTGKLYEYLASGRPVVGLGPPDGDAGALLRETGGGVMVPRDDADALGRELGRLIDAWRAGVPVGGAAPEAVAPYSRRAQTLRLADVVLGRDARCD